MENNTQTEYYQHSDPNYAATSKEFLTKAIVSSAISCLPVGSIIAIMMANKNRNAILEYIGNGGMHTTKVKVSSALSRGGKYSGIAYTIFWAIYLLYVTFVVAGTIIAMIAYSAG